MNLILILQLFMLHFQMTERSSFIIRAIFRRHRSCCRSTQRTLGNVSTKKNASLMLYLQGVNNALEIIGSVSLITLAVLNKGSHLLKLRVNVRINLTRNFHQCSRSCFSLYSLVYAECQTPVN